MATLSVPLNSNQENFIKQLVKSGKAANKAHAVRLSIDKYAEDETLRAVLEAEQEIRVGKGLRGDLDALLAQI